MSLFLSIAIYLILWWLAFFAVLPVGAQSLHEANEAVAPGVERGAPRAPKLLWKMAWAAAIACILWLGVAWAVAEDLFRMRG